MLSLNGFLLRPSATPANAWTAAARAEVELFYWMGGRIESLSLDEAEILEAAVAGDVVVALLRREHRSARPSAPSGSRPGNGYRPRTGKTPNRLAPGSTPGARG